MFFWDVWDVYTVNKSNAGYYVAGPPLLNGRCTSLLRVVVSEMTYTVSSGTLNTTINYQGSCASIKFKASFEKSLSFRKLTKSLNCFRERVEGLEKFAISLFDCVNFLP